MAYTKLTDYAAKDLLLHGDPAKVVKGTELGAEFDSLAAEDALNVKTATKDATGGVAGLTLFKINFKNAANTFTSFFTNANTAARTYTFPDKDLTVAGIVDLTATNTVNTPAGNIAAVTVQAAINELDTEKAALAGSASQAFSALAVNTAKTTVASATTPDIFAVTTGQLIDYTGTATATGFANAPQAGMFRELYCAGACLFTAGANLLIEGIPSGTTITLAAGALVQVRSITTTQFKMTYSLSGTFTATGTGFTVNPTVTAKYKVENGVVDLSIPLLTGTSNATSFTVTGLPACIASASTKYFNLFLGTDNSVNTIVAGYVNGNVITYGVGINNTTWTAANTKQVFTNEFNYSIA